MNSKLLFLLTAAILCVWHSNAQGPTITQSIAAGDIYTIQRIDTAGLSPGGSGTNQTWDFSAIIDNGAIVIDSVVTASSTNFAGIFPNANLAMKNNINNIVEFFDSFPTTLFDDGSIGGSGDSTVTTYYAPPIQLFFPLSYGSFLSDTISGYYVQGATNGTISGNDSVWADGYGTLILPTQTFTNVLRVKTLLTKEINYGVTNTITQILTYDYMIPGYHSFLLEISTSTTLIQAVPLVTKMARYSKNVPDGINTLVPNIFDLSIYPNPATSSMTVKISNEALNGGATIVFTDLLGQVIIKKALEDATQNIDLSGVAKGAYVVNITTAGTTVSKKLIID